MSDSNVSIKTVEGYCIELSLLLDRYKDIFNRIESQLDSIDLSDDQLNNLVERVADRITTTDSAKDLMVAKILNDQKFRDKICDQFRAKLTNIMLYRQTYADFLQDIVSTPSVKQYLENAITYSLQSSLDSIKEEIKAVSKSDIEGAVRKLGESMRVYSAEW
jgi:hypothetical protein